MKPSENWRSVFLLPQSTKKKKKNSKGNSSPSSPRLHFPELQWEPKTTTTTPTPTTTAERRHTMSGPTPRSMLNVQSPDSDVSPKTPLQPSDQTKTDYFSIESSSQAQSQKKDEEAKANDAEPLSRATTLSSIASPSPLESATGSFSAESSRTESYGGRPRGSSIASLSFAPLRNPSLPQGNQKKTNKERIRASSPPPERFQSHVAFDNLPLGEATKNNTLSLTLNVRHRGYQAQRRSRTFMVGVDEHAYSDYALQWLLDELVDDGDEVVCVRVIEKELRAAETNKIYQEEAKKVMDGILKRNGLNRAISIVLEYASGKLHATFQRLIQIHQPAMLIVGTRGRSLGGLQGLVNTRNSFSKYCLQYSPVPVVVVRPTEKREKKKNKRKNDTERQTYVRMLSATGGKHEADSERSSMYEVEVHNTADEEAHQVAKALGLPAAFDPTIKPVDLNALLHPRHQSAPSNLAQTSSAGTGRSSAPPSAAGDSDEEDDDDEDEFETFSGDQLINSSQMDKLHKMEANEAAALKQRKSSLDSSASGVDDDEDEESKASRHSSNS
ncbi:putative universal stress protein family [Colletotrichum scovillei]|uniref:Universal stress protein family n=1 Tax=Colletotrichum scovillei TaxID=1209932 RepID=A0A9P7UJT3_9PEZI|nr:putative universal stress protein family [Colletotrichum scovillei]KAF4774878.1 putative universal stress protein family [Colletotrichum scovillei]KAG7052115.1 universal stress protein family [Colletotrichum scovillei]KAG7071148.1 universal stress protein family [Colletotrichum scovillei]KAG7079420.1 universal stress protein family [Colletotrichum scovillei]